MPNAIKLWKASELNSARKRAMAWFVENGRDLPWRRTSDPYRIWVSEIMLQQTQVTTVIPFYERFLTSFPSVADLAKATLDEVYRHWSGLGYYRRARQMHEAANKIAQGLLGVFPDRTEAVQKLPGIGRYTANAILTFSGDQRLPIVEANTQRLYARLLHLNADTSTKDSQAKLWSFAEQVLPAKNGSGQINQAFMEIGSQICLPKNPHCMICPLHKLCPTYASASQKIIPAPKKAKQFTDLREAALIVRDAKERVLMRRCGQDERWAGLWDFPRFDVTECTSNIAVRKKLASQFRTRFGRGVLIGNELHQLKHAVTRYRITLDSFEAQMDPESTGKWSTEVETVWAEQKRMEDLALSSSGKKLWAWLRT